MESIYPEGIFTAPQAPPLSLRPYADGVAEIVNWPDDLLPPEEAPAGDLGPVDTALHSGAVPPTNGPATVACYARKLARSLRTYEHAEECGAPARGVLVAIAVQLGRLVESIAALVSDALPIEQLPPLIQTIHQLAGEVGHALEIDRLKPQPEFNARLHRFESAKTVSTTGAAKFVRKRWATERPAIEPAWSEQLRAAGRELAGPKTKSRCRPAEGRDQYFRQLHVDGNGNAAIRDHWNGLRDEQRKAIGGPKWRKIQPGEAGREVVKKALGKKT